MKLLLAGLDTRGRAYAQAAQAAGIALSGFWGKAAADIPEACPRAADLEDLLKWDGDWVLLCAPPRKQASLAMAACRAGRDVILPLPAALSPQALEALFDAFLRSGRRLFFASPDRYAGDVAAAGGQIARGDLGRPGLIEMKRVVPTGSAVYGALVRQVDLLMNWLGEVRTAWGFCRRSGRAEYAVLTAELDCGAIACLEALGGGREPERRSYEISFSGGTLRFDSNASHACRLYQASPKQPGQPPAGPEQDPLRLLLLDAFGPGGLEDQSAQMARWLRVYQTAQACQKEAQV